MMGKGTITFILTSELKKEFVLVIYGFSYKLNPVEKFLGIIVTVPV